MNHPNHAENNEPAPASNELGTFGGVFTPSILTILGVIMFMRAGFVVGQAGIFQALLILLLAKSISTLTSLSIAAVSTNTPVSGGGAYFLISRALGPEFGGAIGMALFFAQAVSVPFYILGFTESVVRSFPEMTVHFRSIALATASLLFVIAYVGARWAIKTQYVIMTILGLSVLAFLGGAAFRFEGQTFLGNWHSNYSLPGMSFWVVFAIYFPAVTGIMAGVNMSGDLKDPGRSIPWGTLAAVGVGLLVYGFQILLCGGAQTRGQLVGSSFETLRNQALLGAGFLVVAGVFAATISSAIGSFLGAPRVLQAVARDQVIPQLRPFAKGSAGKDEPRRALWLTLGISLMVIVWAGGDSEGGAFNALASVVTMFFLYTYGMVNLAAFVEGFSANPSFRPRFKYYHWLPALMGATACAGTAMLIDPTAAAAAAVFVILFYIYLRRRVLKVRFGDARWGFAFTRLRNNLLRLAGMPTHPKNWRPTLLVLTGNPKERPTVATYALWIGEERGLVTLARVLVGDPGEIGHLRKPATDQLGHFLHDTGFQALTSVVVSENLDAGLTVLLEGHPLGPLSPNTVIMGWSGDPERASSFIHHLNTVRRLGMSMVLVHDKGLSQDSFNRRIDIWWRGQENGYLMILIAHLLTLNWEWSRARIRLLRLLRDEAGRQPSKEALQELVDAARVDAQAEIIVSEDPLPEVLERHSADASLVILGFKVPEERGEDAYRFQMHFERMLSGLPTTLLVSSSGEADLLA
ncbi:MAG: amino acid permease [Deltaproteobacteria bacterium]|nr:amino acid permease [Deltaproteobacteria bacterium]